MFCECEMSLFKRTSVCKQLDIPGSDDKHVRTNKMERPIEINRGNVEDCEGLFFLYVFLASLRVAPAVPTMKAKQQK